MKFMNTPKQEMGQTLGGRAEAAMARTGSEPEVAWKSFPGEHSCAGPTGMVGREQAEEEEGELAIFAGVPEQAEPVVWQNPSSDRGAGAEQCGYERQDIVSGGTGGEVRKVGWAQVEEPLTAQPRASVWNRHDSWQRSFQLSLGFRTLEE